MKTIKKIAKAVFYIMAILIFLFFLALGFLSVMGGGVALKILNFAILDGMAGV